MLYNQEIKEQTIKYRFNFKSYNFQLHKEIHHSKSLISEMRALRSTQVI